MKIKISTSVLIFISLLTLFTFYQLEQLPWTLMNINLYKSIRKEPNFILSNSLTILLWTTHSSSRANFYAIDDFISDGCPAQCQVTENKEMIHIVDAVAVHATQETGDDVILPIQLKLNQIRLFFRLESPQYPTFRQLPNIYNWTMTYRRDSDIPAFYNNFRLKVDSKLKLNDTLQMDLDSREISPEKLSQLKYRFLTPEKTKLIAWTVSNCHTVSKREDFVDKLKNYTKIDVYGGCGNLKCSLPRMAYNYENCYAQLGQMYKFYLAFENSVCVDYVTEKFFNALENNMVPIVYGGADYKALAPPGSFIDAQTFTVDKLGKYIEFLDQHPEEYLKYFLWKDHYEFYKRNWWCDFCVKLWDHAVMDSRGQWFIDPFYSKFYNNISTWWLEKPTESGDDHVPACKLPS